MRRMLAAWVVGIGLSGLAACTASTDEDAEAVEGAQSPAAQATEVEIEASITQTDIDPAALGNLEAPPEDREVIFYDTKDLVLKDAKKWLRTRVLKTGAEHTVKVANADPALVARLSRLPEGFKPQSSVDLDASGNTAPLSSSFQFNVQVLAKPGPAATSADILARFTSDQKSLLGTVPEGLVATAPIKSTIWKILSPEITFAKKVKIDRWQMPDGTGAIQVSIDVKGNGSAPPDAATVSAKAKAFSAWLASKKLTVTTPAASRTDKVLATLKR
jgi:hypothetical protein